MRKNNSAAHKGNLVYLETLFVEPLKGDKLKLLPWSWEASVTELKTIFSTWWGLMRCTKSWPHNPHIFPFQKGQDEKEPVPMATRKKLRSYIKWSDMSYADKKDMSLTKRKRERNKILYILGLDILLNWIYLLGKR